MNPPSQPAVSSAKRAVVRNLVFIYLFNLVWALGNPMVNSSTMIVSYFDKLGSRPLVFGLLQVASSLPVLIQFLPRLVRLRSTNRKWSMAAVYMLAGAAYIGFGFVALHSASNPGLFIPLLLVLYFVVYCLYQLAVILYLDYILRLFPAKILGRFYGFNGLFMSAGAMAGGAIAVPLLKASAFPMDYGSMFMLAGGIFLLSSVLPLFTRQVETSEPERVLHGIRAYAVHAATLLRKPAVKYFTLLIVLIYVNFSAYGFALIFLNRELGRSVDPMVATFVAYGSQAILLMAVGVSFDRLGRLKTLVGYMSLVLAANVVLLLPLRHTEFFVFASYGMYALFISMVKVRLASEIVPAEERLDAVILANVSGVVAGSLASLAYGVLAGILDSYRFIFVCSALFIVVLFFVARRLGTEIRKLEAVVAFPPTETKEASL
jgi:hypothetical protein